MEIIIDSNFASLEEAIRGTRAPTELQQQLVLFEVLYFSFDQHVHQGQLVLHHELVRDVKDIFAELFELRFPIAQAVPIVAYGWNDEASMQDNNCSGFNYRVILGTDRLSNHSFGRALDINPLQNPYYARDGKVHPKKATYHTEVPGTLVWGEKALQAFLSRGFTWGGNWKTPVDYQHLEKP